MNNNKIFSIAGLIATILLTIGMLGFLGVLPVRAGEGAQEASSLTTPELILQGLEARQIDGDTANLYLAYALGAYEKLPQQYRSDVPWEGTVPLLDLTEAIQTQSAGRFQKEIADIIAARGACSTSTASLPNVSDSTHFHIEYGTIGGGLTITSYTTSLETVWGKEITEFGWAAPPVLTGNPPPGNRYHVRIDNLSGGLYGYVSSGGVHAGLVGDNPNTAWNDVDAYASCMVLNSDYSPFPGTSQQALDATTAHEFNHSIQFGYGALTGSNRPAQIFVEGGATWMEDEVFDAANDNYNYLWPNFSMAMGDYTSSPYPYWITFRGMTERYGTGTAGAGEQVMQDFWETLSKGASGDGIIALNTALVNRGTSVGDAFHAYAIAVKFNKTCGGGFVYPYCFEEGAAYVGARGATAVHATISTIGNTYSGSLADSFAINWVRLPTGSSNYQITLQNTSAGGALRGSIVCETGSALNITALPSVAGPGGSASIASFNPSGCSSVVAVITNQSNATASTARTYQLSTSAAASPPGAATLISPSGSITTSTPTYTWNKVNTATWYYLWINNAAGTAIGQQWYPASQICGSSTCSVTPGMTLPAGNYTWWIQTWNDAGYGPWSNGKSFSVGTAGLPGIATLVSPSGGITDTTPTYTWNKVSTSTWYYLWVNNAAGTPVIQQWYMSSQACGASTCSVTPSLTLPAGSYTWWIQTWNDAGYGPWSNGKAFTVQTVPPPGAATLVSPSGSITDTTPTYTWNKVSDSTWYYLWVDGPSGNVIQQWYTSAQACGSSTCSVTPNVALAGGNYTWWIDTWNDAGYGPWSNAKNFSLPGSGTGFDSQFNGTSAGWESHSGAWGIASSKWYTSPGLAGLWASTSYNGTFSNFDYQVRLRRTGDSSYSNCVMIRGAPTPLAADNDWNSGYGFCYVTGGSYSVWLSTGGAGWTPVQNWTSTSSLHTGTVWNVVRIVANGSSLYLYFNGALVWSSADPFLSSGRVGIEFSSPSPSTGNQLWVDWAKLSTIVPREITDTISAEQQALNQAALEGVTDMHVLPTGK